MILVKILKRKDAFSVIVAVLLAMIISQPLTSTTIPLTNTLTAKHGNGLYGTGYYGNGWTNEYLFPIVWALLQILVLEILGWVYVIGCKIAARRAK